MSLRFAQRGLHKPERLDGWLWQAAVITSVYLISVLFSVPLSPLSFSPRTRSLTPLGRSALLGKPLWTRQKDTTKTEHRTAHVHTHTQITNTCVVKHASPPRGFGMFRLNKHKLVYALRWRSAVLKDSKNFFCCKNDFRGRQTWVLNLRGL